MRPRSRNTIRLAASRAKPISWVTTTIVMPSRRQRRASRSAPRRPAPGRARWSARRTAAAPDAWLERGRFRPAASVRRTAWLGKRPACRSGPTLASSASASCRTCALGRRCTCTGASMTFCRTVRCGQSAKCWKTMPMRVRMRDRSRSLITTPPLVTPMRSPLRYTCPLSGFSSQLMHRSSVDLPEPDGPSRQTVSPRCTRR